jgi:hypothetical protein
VLPIEKRSVQAMTSGSCAVANDVGEELDTGEPLIDLASVAFARRLANLLTVSREQSGLSRRVLARRSGGRFTARDLKAAEEAKRVYGPTTIGELAVLYEVDLSVLLPERLPLTIDPAGIVGTGGIEIRFDPADPDGMLSAYLRLVRALRRQQKAKVIDLRRDDVELLAVSLGLSGLDVVERLGTLMGSTRAQRGVMRALLTAGAKVVGLASSSSTASAPASSQEPASWSPRPGPDGRAFPSAAGSGNMTSRHEESGGRRAPSGDEGRRIAPWRR